MNKHSKFFLIFALMVSIILTTKLYYENKNIEEIKELSIKYEAQSIADFLNAFRTTYQKIFIEKHVKLDESSIQFLPVRTTNEIAKIFSSLNTKSKIATVSSRPRNIKNMANERQLKVIERFEQNKMLESSFKHIGNKYFYSKPLYITKVCLKCHGRREDAPDIIKSNYTQAYDYKLGELRGIIDIEIEQTKLGMLLDESNTARILFIFLLLSIILGVTSIYVKLNKDLELKIQEELEKNEQKDQHMIQQSRLAQMGEMISMIAHQWRQPLSAISSTSSSIAIKAQLNKLDKDAAMELSNRISHYSQHLSSTIDDFRDFFRSNKEKKETTYNELTISVLGIVETSIKNQNITLIQNLNSKEVFDTYPNELRQVILNLIKNAEDALIEQDIKNPTITIDTLGDTLKISDNAGGVPEDIMDKIFDPYFSTKSKKDGTGLGLYMSKTIIEDHCDGELSVVNVADGAEFTIKLNNKA